MKLQEAFDKIESDEWLLQKISPADWDSWLVRTEVIRAIDELVDRNVEGISLRAVSPAHGPKFSSYATLFNAPKLFGAYDDSLIEILEEHIEEPESGMSTLSLLAILCEEMKKRFRTWFTVGIKDTFGYEYEIQLNMRLEMICVLQMPAQNLLYRMRLT
jgi:hypothetical protein